MKTKLVLKSLQGWNGWESCLLEDLKNGLKNHIEKGDMVDVANYAILIDARTTEKQSPQAVYENMRKLIAN